MSRWLMSISDWEWRLFEVWMFALVIFGFICTGVTIGRLERQVERWVMEERIENLKKGKP